MFELIRVKTYLVEEDIFAVVALGGKVVENAVEADAVLLAQTLPELSADCTQRQER